MADICDMAQDHYERTMASALGALEAKARTLEVTQTGYCLSCGEPIAKDSKNQRFCNAQHRDEYDARASRQKRVS